MKFRKLGKTGLMVSEIGLGTAQIGGPALIKGAYCGSPRIDKKVASGILNFAYDSGINFYDTSDKYGDGESERLLGSAFLGKRDKVIIATKCGLTNEGGRCFDEQYLRKCLDGSLKNLSTDYVDIFQLTKPPISVIKKGDIYNTLDKFKKEGKIRFSGISTDTDEDTKILISDNKVDTLQIFYNLLYIKPNESNIVDAYNAGIGLIIRSPLSSGVLTGKYTLNTKFSSEDDRSQFLYGETLASRVNMVNKINKNFSLSDKYTILHFSLNYLLSNSKISSIIPGVSKVEQLRNILELNHIERMEPSLILEVEQFLRNNLES